MHIYIYIGSDVYIDMYLATLYNVTIREWTNVEIFNQMHMFVWFVNILFPNSNYIYACITYISTNFIQKVPLLL